MSFSFFSNMVTCNELGIKTHRSSQQESGRKQLSKAFEIWRENYFQTRIFHTASHCVFLFFQIPKKILFRRRFQTYKISSFFLPCSLFQDSTFIYVAPKLEIKSKKRKRCNNNNNKIGDCVQENIEGNPRMMLKQDTMTIVVHWVSRTTETD